MALLVVEGDPVEGTDTHNITGTTGGGQAPYTGTGRYDYVGSVTGGLSDVVRIDGVAIAITSSSSSLDAGQTAPGGGHFSGSGSSFLPPGPDLPPAFPLSIIDPIGTGTPSSSAGSAFVTVDGSAVLLDGDAIDTCDGLGVPANSTVTASTQDFVSASE